MSVKQLIAALSGLQVDADCRQEFNEWLQTFQKSPEAWQTTYEVLSSPQQYPRDLKIFCSQTLRHKIGRDLYQVPKTELLALKDKVIRLLELNVDLVGVVGVQLCVALASLAMQVPEWHSALEEMIHRLSARPELLMPLFEFLKVLPDKFQPGQCGLIEPQELHDRAKRLVEDNANNVMQFMVQQAEYLNTNDSKVLFLDAVNAWLHEVKPSDVVQSPVLTWILAAASHEETLEAAADCLVTLISELSDINEPEVQESMQTLFPKLIELRALSKHYADNTEVHRNMTRVYSRAGEAWHMVILQQPIAFLPLLDAIVDCALVEAADLEIVQITFPFFSNIGLMLETSTGVLNPRFQEASTILQPAFRCLLQGLTDFLRYPQPTSPTTDLFNGDREEEDKFREFRYDVGDVLKVCCVVLTPDIALDLCAQNLEAATRNNAPWQPIEAILFCVRMLARTVPNNNTVLPRVLDCFAHLPAQEKVIHAAILLIGRYSSWAAHNTEHIGLQLEYILQGIVSPFPEVWRAGAHALMYFCSDCAEQLVGSLERLVEFYNSLTLDQVDLESLCKIGDGIGHILCVVDVPLQATALEHLFTPVIRDTAALGATGAPGSAGTADSFKAATNVGQRIHALGSFVATIKGDDDSSALVQQVKLSHEPFAAALVAFGGNCPAMLEGVLRFWIYAMHSCGGALVAGVQSLLRALPLTPLFNAGSLGAIQLEFAGAVAQCYNGYYTGLIESGVVELAWQFLQYVIKSFLSVYESTINKESIGYELLECGFHLLSDVATHFAPMLVFSDVFERSFAAAVRSLASYDTEVLLPASNVVEDIAQLCLQPFEQNADPTLASSIFSATTAVFKRQGPELIHQLFFGLIYNYDADFDITAQKLFDICLQIGKVEAIDWLRTALASLPDNSLSAEEQLQAMERIFSYLTVHGGRGAGSVVNSLAKTYVERSVLPR